MPLAQRVELLHRSSERMLQALTQSRDKLWWGFMRREAWVHLKRAVELWWMLLRGKA